MLNTTPSQEMTWHGSKRQSSGHDDVKKSGGGGGGGAFTSGHHSHLTNLAHRFNRFKKSPPKPEPHKKRTIHIPAPPPAARRSGAGQASNRNTYVPLQSPTAPPATVASPVSRTDTASAASTVYTVRYHPISETPPAPRLQTAVEERPHVANPDDAQPVQQQSAQSQDIEKGAIDTEDTAQGRNRGQWNWQNIASINPFRRRGRSPPPEIQRGRVIEPLVVEDVPLNIPQRNYTGLALKDRLGTFAAQQGERFRSRKGPTQQTDANLPVTIIPAQPRGRTWSPEILQQQRSQSEGSGEQTSTESRQATPLATQNTNTPSPLPTVSEDPGTPGRASAIRFTSDTFLPPNARPQVQRERTLSSSSSVALGNEVSENNAETSLSQATSSPNATSQPTNHDR